MSGLTKKYINFFMGVGLLNDSHLSWQTVGGTMSSVEIDEKLQS